jgi:anti-sigma factor ChrR (cupin superfamily)
VKTPPPELSPQPSSSPSLPPSLAIGDLLAESRRPDFGWTPFRPGVDEHRLYGAHEPGRATASLLRYAPGAHVPRHRHVAIEHIYVLSGSQRDERGTYRAGALLVNFPGAEHAVVSDDGCTVLAIWERPVVFVDAG